MPTKVVNDNIYNIMKNLIFIVYERHQIFSNSEALFEGVD